MNKNIFTLVNVLLTAVPLVGFVLTLSQPDWITINFITLLIFLGLGLIQLFLKGENLTLGVGVTLWLAIGLTAGLEMFLLREKGIETVSVTTALLLFVFSVISQTKFEDKFKSGDVPHLV